jgi:hypothetical protein
LGTREKIASTTPSEVNQEPRIMPRRTRFPLAFIAALLLLLPVAANFSPVAAQAACTVTVVNQTGYDLVPLKLVREKGESKKVVGQTPVSNAKSYAFRVGQSGKYRVYGLLTKDGEKKYAKGNLYTLDDGDSYQLILKKVVFSEKGNSISFISKDEFDNLK